MELGPGIQTHEQRLRIWNWKAYTRLRFLHLLYFSFPFAMYPHKCPFAPLVKEQYFCESGSSTSKFEEFVNSHIMWPYLNVSQWTLSSHTAGMVRKSRSLGSRCTGKVWMPLESYWLVPTLRCTGASEKNMGSSDVRVHELTFNHGATTARWFFSF